MVARWVWTSEIIFLTQIPFFLDTNWKCRKNLSLILIRYILTGVITLWFFTDLPWIILLASILFDLLMYAVQIHRFEKKALNQHDKISEFIAFFSLVNFVFAIPFFWNPNRKFSRIVHILINLVGVGVVIYSLIISRLNKGWSCYSNLIYPSISDYNFGVCPENLSDQDAPICATPGIHCDDRFDRHHGQTFYQIGTILVTSSGVLYTFGCPFF